MFCQIIKWPDTHECTFHWKPVMTHLWMNRKISCQFSSWCKLYICKLPSSNCLWIPVMQWFMTSSLPSPSKSVDAFFDWQQNTNATHENNKNSYLIIMIFFMCMQKYCSDTVVFLQQCLSCQLHELSSPAPLDIHGQKPLHLLITTWAITPAPWAVDGSPDMDWSHWPWIPPLPLFHLLYICNSYSTPNYVLLKNQNASWTTKF
jgi:hypothetical protein